MGAPDLRTLSGPVAAHGEHELEPSGPEDEEVPAPDRPRAPPPPDAAFLAFALQEPARLGTELNSDGVIAFAGAE